MSDDGSVVAGSASECTAVANLFLHITDNGTFGALADGKDVADGECGLFACVDESTGMKSLGCDEGFFTELVLVWIAEDDAGKRGTATSIVDNLLYDSSNVTIALSKVESTELGGGLVVVGVCLELEGRVN